MFGLAPALQLSHATPARPSRKREGGDPRTAGPPAHAAAWWFETALAMMLLVGATLLIRTFVALHDVRPGFDPHGVITLQTSLADQVRDDPSGRDADPRDRGPARRSGIEATAMAISLPMQGASICRSESRARCRGFAVSRRRAMAIDRACVFQGAVDPILRGRAFERRDTAGADQVVIVNSAFAKKFFPGADPIGQRLTIGKGLGPEFEDPTRTIVGIVGDVRERGLDADPPPVLYLPGAQISDAFTKLSSNIIPPRWIIKVTGPLTGVAAAVQKEFLAVDAQLPVAKVRPMDEVIAESIAKQNFNMLLLTIFGAIALVLAAVGVYGLMSYSVEQATHDISIRLALGAERGDIMSLVVGHGMKLAGAGLLVGSAAAFGDRGCSRRCSTASSRQIR